MSILHKIPVNSSPIVTKNTFSATFTGTYNFTNVTANQNQIIIPMNQNCVYLIERTNFSMDIPEDEFQSAIQANPAPQMRFTTLKTNTLIFQKPQPYINYVDNLEMSKFVPCNQKNDAFRVSFECVLNQTPGLVGDLTIYCFLQLSIYEIQSTDWVKYFDGPKVDQGEYLRTRGI